MRARDLIAVLERVDGDTEVFRSHGAFSQEVIDAETTLMCSADDGYRWTRCRVAGCPNVHRQLGVLIV